MRFLKEFLAAKEESKSKDLSILVLLFGIAFFQTLGRMPLMEPDEGRYAEIPREMLERGDFITPCLNYVKYFEKPPLHYWLNALSFSIFGQNEFAARLPGALMGLLAVLLVYHTGRKLFCRRAGLLAALILGTSTGFLLQARIDFIDLTLTCTLSASLSFFLLASREGEPRKDLYYHLFYLCAALALLSKGLIAIVFPCAIIFCYILITRRWRLLREIHPMTGIPLFLLAGAPWFIAVSLRNPEFARFFFIHEHFERFLTKVHGRYKPFWYFIPVLAGTMLPWSFFIPSGFRGVWKERLSPSGESRLFLALWALVVFLFFSASDSKLVPYILPVFPPLALLMGNALAGSESSINRFVKMEGYLVSVTLALLGTGLICYPFVVANAELSLKACLVTGGILLSEGILTFVYVYRRSFAELIAGLIICSYLVGIVTSALVLAEIAERKTVKELGTIVRERAGKDAVVASFGLVQGLSFYAKRRVLVVGYGGETDFGSRQGDNSAWFLDVPHFIPLWDSSVKVYVLTQESESRAWGNFVRNAPKLVAREGDYLLVTNH